METVKCTPRPWRAELGEVHEVRDSEGGRICLLTQLRGKHGLGGRRADHESPANAYLIAAAPEMYEALKAAEVMVRIMLECWGDTLTNDCGKFRNITGSSTLKEIRAALAKADGKEGA